MKKAVIAIVVIVVGMFIIATDLVVSPFRSWAQQNHTKPYVAKLHYFMAGYLYMVAQRQERAVEMYKKGFELFPDYPEQDQREAHYRCGLYYEGKKDYNSATAEYVLIQTKWPDAAGKLNLDQRISRFKAYGGNLALDPLLELHRAF